MRYARVEGLALEAELHKAREQHRDEITRLSEGHATRLKEFSDRLCVDGAVPRAVGLISEEAETAAKAMATPVACAIAQLVEEWRSYIAEDHEKCEGGRNSYATKAQRRRCLDTSNPTSSGHEQVVAEFLRETATRLDAKCCRAVRRARVLEWELCGVRQKATDASVALEEARVERARLSARAAAAEATVVACFSPVGTVCVTDMASSSYMAGCNSGGDGFSRGILPGGFCGARATADAGRRGSCTAAAFSLLEKRLAAALEDLVAAGAARAAAEAGEATATARAEAAEVDATGKRMEADKIEADLERDKALALEGLRTEALEWRRQIRVDLGRWWQDELVS